MQAMHRPFMINELGCGSKHSGVLSTPKTKGAHTAAQSAVCAMGSRDSQSSRMDPIPGCSAAKGRNREAQTETQVGFTGSPSA